MSVLRRSVASLFVVVAVCGLGELAADPAATAAKPSLSLSSTVLVPGQSVTISGSGWPLNENLQASLCGDNAVDGTIDCLDSSSVIMTPATGAGLLSYSLQVSVPPRPCPCVVLVTSLQNFSQTKLPVQVAGIPTNPVKSVAPSSLPQTVKVIGLRVTGGSWVAAWFGESVSRDLVVTFHNSGPSPVLNPIISATWGRQGHTDHVINSPTIAMIQPNETRQISLPFRLDPLSFGSYVVAGRLTGPAIPVVFRTQTSSWPIGLMAIAALLIVGLLARAVMKRRSRRAAAAREEGGSDSQEGQDMSFFDQAGADVTDRVPAATDQAIGVVSGDEDRGAENGSGSGDSGSTSSDTPMRSSN